MSKCISHEACPKCKSKDNLARYEDGSAYCFSPACDYFEKSEEGYKPIYKETKRMPTPIKYDGERLRLGDRGIELDQVKRYNVLTKENGTVTFPYYDKDGNLVATKMRNKEKKFVYTGDTENLELFGQSRFGTGGKYLTITEGEFDAMACRQMLGDYPVVSIHSSTSVERDIKNNLDFIESFDNVVLCFDSDEAGKDALRKASELISPNKVLIPTLNDYKDANEYLKNKAGSKFVRGWWESKRHSPVGVVSFGDAWGSIQERKETTLLKLPSSLPVLSEMLGGGIAKGEITVVGALTSIGKTTFVNNLMYGFLSEANTKVGYLGLETTVGEVSSSLVDLEAKSKITSKDELQDAREVFDSIEWKDNLQIVDHQGSLELDEMFKKIRNTIIAFELDVVIVDPLQASLPDLSNDTVKLAMDKFLKLAKQTNASIVIVSHMRKPDNKNPHDVSEYDLLGSSAINQVAFNTILLSRDKMGATDLIKCSTKVQLVKARRTGRTGEAGWLMYEQATGVLTAGSDPYEFEEEVDEWG